MWTGCERVAGMKFKGILIGAASGSVGSDVFSHNRGGQYIRNRTFPVQPNTAPQLGIRGTLGFLSNAWSTVLTQAQREGWDVYSLHVLLPNRLGRLVNVGGKNMFVRALHTRLRHGLPGASSVAPTIFSLAGLAPVGQSGVDATADTVDITFDESDPWVTEPGGQFYVWSSTGRSPAINYFKGPYLFAGNVDGSAVTPPTSPVTVPLATPVLVGEKVFFRVKSNMRDGRISADQRFFGIAV